MFTCADDLDLAFGRFSAGLRYLDLGISPQIFRCERPLVSQKAFDRLDKPTQAALLKAAATAEARGWKTSEEKNTWYKEQLVKNGMTVTGGSDQLRSDFRKIGLTMTADWTTQTGKEGEAIIEAYRK